MKWRITVVFVALLLAGVVQRAQAGDGVVALQTADASCPDDSGAIYVSCGNGTVTDNRTGLVWLQNVDCYGRLDWHEAVEIVANLSDIPAGSAFAAHDCGLSDGSSPGEWRLPSAAEWESMIADALALGCVSPSLTADAGLQCHSPFCVSFPSACSFSGVVGSIYWSSTTFVNDPNDVWGVSLGFGFLGNGLKSSDFYSWPVRGGQ